MILETKKAKAATAEVLETHCIASDRSADLVSGATNGGAGGSGGAAAANGGGKGGGGRGGGGARKGR